MKRVKSLLTLLLCGVLSFSTIINVHAEEEDNSDDSNAKKEESVYVLLNNDGSVQNTTVSEWLHDDKGVSNLTDVSYLNDIKNTKTSVDPVINNSEVVWNTDDHDVYYQGTSNEALPISVEISYSLDGVQMNAEEIVGKSGRLEITIHVINNTKTTEAINGSEKDVSVIFPYMVMTDLDTDKYTDVKADDAVIVNEGKNEVVGFISVSGIDTALDSIDDEQIDKIRDKIKDTFVISMQTENAEIPSILIGSLATDRFTDEDLDMSTLDDLTSGVSQIKDATKTILDGTSDLADANVQLNDKMSEFQSKFGDFSSGLNTAKDGSATLLDGAKKLESGASQLDAGLDQLKEGLDTAMAAGGSAQIAAITQQLTDAATALQAAQQQMAQMQTTVAALAALPSSVKQGLLDQEPTLDGAINQGVDGGLSQLVAAGGTNQIAQAICGANAGNVQVNADATASGSINEGSGTFYVSSGQDTTTYFLADQTQATVDTYAQQDPTMSVTVDSQSTAQLDMAACVATTQAILDSQLANGGAIESAANQGAQQGGNTAYEAIADGVEANLNTQMAGLNQTLVDANTTIDQMLAMIQSFQTLVSQEQQLLSGLAALQPAVNQLKAGSSTLSTGTTDLYKGAVTLNNGLNTLGDASNTITDAINQFKDATGKLVSVTGELHDGVNTFSKEGIDELSNKVDSAVADINSALDAINAANNKTAEYSNYAGAPEGIETSVKFIMKTQAVTIPSTKIDDNNETAENSVVEEETNTTFWDRIKDLIG